MRMDGARCVDRLESKKMPNLEDEAYSIQLDWAEVECIQRMDEVCAPIT